MIKPTSRKDALWHFRREWAGRYLVSNGMFGANPWGAQCVNVPNTWAERLGTFGWEGNATSFQSQRPAGWAWVWNTPMEVPPRGSVLVFRAHTGAPYGHVSVFLWGGRVDLVSFDQNWPVGSSCHRQRHSYDYVAGWFAPMVHWR